MIKVVKGNVVLRVEDKLLDFYVNKGFTAKTLDGQVIKDAIPNDVPSLRRALADSKQTIQKLTAEIEELKAQLATAKTTVEQTVTTEEKPKRTRKKNTDEE